MGGNFPGESFPGGIFLEAINVVNYFLKTLLFFYMMFFSQFPDVFSIIASFTIARSGFLMHV